MRSQHNLHVQRSSLAPVRLAVAQNAAPASTRGLDASQFVSSGLQKMDQLPHLRGSLQGELTGIRCRRKRRGCRRKRRVWHGYHQIKHEAKAPDDSPPTSLPRDSQQNIFQSIRLHQFLQPFPKHNVRASTMWKLHQARAQPQPAFGRHLPPVAAR